MSFRKDKTTAAQTSANAAAQVTSALVEQGLVSADDAGDKLTELFDFLFARLSPIVDADNALFEAVETIDNAPRPKASSNGGTARAAKTGGARKGGGTSNLTLDDAYAMEIKGGSFAGVTLEKLAGLTADEAAEYGYGDGMKTGADYIAWMASDINTNEYSRARGKLVAEAEGITPLEAYK